MKYHLISILFTVISVGVYWQTKEPLIHANMLEKITLIDTFSNPLVVDTARYITTAYSCPMYIGEFRDTLQMNYHTEEIQHRTYEWNQFHYPKTNSIEIFVDTSRTTGEVNDLIYHRDLSDSALQLERKKWKSYPVLIKNLVTDTLAIGFGAYIPLVIEAKDSSGTWQPIQENFSYFCGTGLTHFYLPPNNILLTTCRQFAGDYQTKMRLSFGFNPSIYSNEFTGWINYSQFAENPVEFFDVMGED